MVNAESEMRQSKTFVAWPSNEGELSSYFFERITHGSIRKPLCFHAVSFGPVMYYLQRMAQLALEIQNDVPHDSFLPADSVITSSFTTALDTVNTCAILTDIESLTSPRYGLQKRS